VNGLTQRERVLRLLQHKPHGVSPYDFTPPTADGGKPIMRVAARILELRDEGLDIETRTSPNGAALYVLVPTCPEPTPDPPAPADGPTSQTNLFDLLSEAA
jgi:hypothetical protein